MICKWNCLASFFLYDLNIIKGTTLPATTLHLHHCNNYEFYWPFDTLQCNWVTLITETFQHLILTIHLHPLGCLPIHTYQNIL